MIDRGFGGFSTNTMTAHLDTGETDAAAALSLQRATNRELQMTIAQLRIEMETIAASADAVVQRALAESADEISHLRASVQAMRNQLEAKVAASQAEVQVVRASAHAETLQLQAAIFTLRSELEAARFPGAAPRSRIWTVCWLN